MEEPKSKPSTLSGMFKVEQRKQVKSRSVRWYCARPGNNKAVDRTQILSQGVDEGIDRG